MNIIAKYMKSLSEYINEKRENKAMLHSNTKLFNELIKYVNIILNNFKEFEDTIIEDDDSCNYLNPYFGYKDTDCKNDSRVLGATRGVKRVQINRNTFYSNPIGIDIMIETYKRKSETLFINDLTDKQLEALVHVVKNRAEKLK